MPYISRLREARVGRSLVSPVCIKSSQLARAPALQQICGSEWAGGLTVINYLAASLSTQKLCWETPILHRESTSSKSRRALRTSDRATLSISYQGRLLSTISYSPRPPLFFTSPTHFSSNVPVLVFVCECVCDLAPQPALIGLELSIDQSGLRAEIKVFLSLDTPVARWECRGDLDRTETSGLFWPPSHIFRALRGVSWLFFLLCWS